MKVSVNGQQIYDCYPMYAGRVIMVAIDSSKSNSAIAVGDECGNEIGYIELNGKEDGTTEEATLKLCQAERKALRILFKDAKPRYVGIENIITKVVRGRETGMTEHESRFKITAVFNSFIAFFQDEFDITPQLINNKAWKSATLPQEFCKLNIGKGSLAYFKSINSKYRFCSDDVCDAVCILKYMCMTNNVQLGYKITNVELSSHKFHTYIVNKNYPIGKPEMLFLLNEDLTLEQNVKTISHALASSGKVGIANVKTNWLEWDDLYKYCVGKFEMREPVLKLIVLNEV